MKARMFILSIMLLSLIMSLSAQRNDEKLDMQGVFQVIGEAFQLALESIETHQEINDTHLAEIYNSAVQSSQERTTGSERAFLGVTSSELTLRKARELEYPHNYGVLITGTVNNSPARLNRIQADDILMSINDTNILDDKQLSRVIDSYLVGDKITLRLYRDGREVTMEVELSSRTRVTPRTTTVTDTQRKTTKKKSETGYGGGSWYPMWIDLGMEDVSFLVNSLGFSSLDEDGLLYHGGGGKIAIGKGFFLGGMGGGYSLENNRSITLKDGTPVSRRMKYTSSFGGVTLDKRFALHKNFLVSPGIMLGGGSHRVRINQIDRDYDWFTLYQDFSELYNSSATFQKSYFVVRPSFEMMYRFLSWMAIRGEVSYLYGYSPYNGWKTNIGGRPYETSNSPNTKFEGLSFSVGPWFGF